MNRMAQDYRLNFRLNKACEADISKLCPNLCSPGAPCGGMVLQCLQVGRRSLACCLTSVHRIAGLQVTLQQAGLASTHTPDSVPSIPLDALARLLACLLACWGPLFSVADKPSPGGPPQEKQDNVTGSDCQAEVFYYQLMEVSDYRNDVILAEACRNDVEQYCSDVEPGEGRVHQCLRFNRDLISERCRWAAFIESTCLVGCI